MFEFYLWNYKTKYKIRHIQIIKNNLGTYLKLKNQVNRGGIKMTIKKSFETIAVNGVSGGDRRTGAISFPIYQSATLDIMD